MKKAIIALIIIGLAWALYPFYQSYQAKKNLEERKVLEAEHREKGGYKATTVEECINEEACVWYAFEGIAFGTELEEDKVFHSKLINKREENLEILLMTDISEYHYRLVKTFLNKIEDLVPFKILFANEPSNPEFYLFVSSQPNKDVKFLFSKDLLSIDETGTIWNKLVNTFYNTNAQCFGKVFLFDKNQIGYGFIFLNTNIFEACLEEELVQSLGLMNDINGFQFSAFNDGAIIKMTKLDWLLFEVLYDDRIKAGMNINEVQEIFPQIYQDKLTNYGDSQ
ncbi:DUF2927 domain-containing protein [Phaeodactylibacter sp.]|uniref:DUF2927 domain-containing protein n=1 Tax=Phaeodactylibacter sp. TaxID=1940289 RepID=UPI0025CE3773|nr:DUF2927 domain-containing protein [Phaeodactylibacter sp.]MCI4649479.1 DUF2927 domain-containing protein [Phaeodactylibacter sp.]MCI5091198.1 DUF2927 domain-containing protein [Phaeodactylibacter sp.]